MVDHATPNLASRDFDATTAFYRPLGFTVAYRDDGWMILTRGTVMLEFFPDPDLDPATSSLGACLRLDDADAFHDECAAVGVPTTPAGWPRVRPLRLEASGLRIGALVDPDCNLLRLVQNAAPTSA